MGWEIRRYGGKVQPGGSGYSEFAESRFLTVVILFLATVSSYMFTYRWYAELYIPLCFLYTLVGFIPELFKRLQEFPMIFFSLLVMGGIHVLELRPFYHSHRIPDTWKYQKILDEPAVTIFMLSNLAIILLCLGLMYVRYRQQKKYPDQEVH
ncbi:MAG: hypothetical protein OIF51_18045 [Cellvibrionaceae bacterium]|nr:hypothetical protein [Cellvibrionaceae bacterium]